VKYLVTGGAGFIGSALAREVIARGHELVIYDDFSRGLRESVPSNSGIVMVEGDIRDRERVDRTVAEHRPDRLVHLAALHFIPDCVARPKDTLDINVEGTRSVFDACARHGVGNVVFASSAAVYAPVDVACREADTPVGPTDVYGESKVRGEELVAELFARTGCHVSALRIFNAVGPRETNPHVLPHLLESLATSDTVELGNMEAKRDYIDTRDIARAIVTIAEGARGQTVYNVGSGRACSVSEIVDLLRAKVGRPLTVMLDPKRLRPSDRPLLLADVGKVRAELGWAPAIPLEDALDELIRHYRIPVGARPSA
jgi:UDP-glucose 4-epimerase